MNEERTYRYWLEHVKTEEEREELLRLSPEEIRERFSAPLDFGTAGMRGIIGLGTANMNLYTVMQATKGLADYISSLGSAYAVRGVAISYDTRRMSREFAYAAARILATEGVSVKLFDNVRPVPMLSFAVRHLGCFMGIMITASHNPKEYNGYKVYGEDGAQLSPEATQKVVEFIRKVPDFGLKLKTRHADFRFKRPNEFITFIGRKVDKAYFKQILKLTLSPREVRRKGRDIKLVYTPVHGSGYMPVTHVLKKLGIRASVVEEQIAPDPNFSTVEVPNPELGETLSLGIKLANEINADVVFGTDPDCDRLGVALRNKHNVFVTLTGNQVGILLMHYILTRLEEEGNLPANGAVVKSIVTTDMAKVIAKDFRVALFETLVGFKFIGEKIKEWEKTGDQTFLFGFEESCGYLRGTHARDKDAVVASMLMAELVCYYADKGTSVFDVLSSLYQTYGTYEDKVISLAFAGADGKDKMSAFMQKIRTSRPEELGIRVTAVRDYLAGMRTDTEGGEQKLGLPASDILYFELEGGGRVCLRPSGTEPKLKVYLTSVAEDKERADAQMAEIETAVQKLL